MEPESGRFVGRDAFEGIVSSPLSRAAYGYASLSPAAMSDPSGNFASAAETQVTAALAGMMSGFQSDVAFASISSIESGGSAGLRDLAVGAASVGAAYAALKVLGPVLRLGKRLASRFMTAVMEMIPSRYTVRLLDLSPEAVAVVARLPGPPSERVTLFRAVSVEEAQDLWKTREFRGIAGTFEQDKWFVDHIEGAKEFGRKWYNGGDLVIIELDAPKGILDRAYSPPNLDQLGGTAHCIPLDDLAGPILEMAR